MSCNSICLYGNYNIYMWLYFIKLKNQKFLTLIKKKYVNGIQPPIDGAYALRINRHVHIILKILYDQVRE